MVAGGMARAAMKKAFGAGGGRLRCFASATHAAAKTDATSPVNDAIAPKMPAFDYSPPKYTGPSAAEILRKRKEYLSPAMPTFYEQPVRTNFDDRIINRWFLRFFQIFRFSSGF